MTDFKPTEEQEAVVNAVRHSRESVLIRAYAGAAKTTTLTLAAQAIRIPGLALAFNRHIKAELAKKFPANFVVQTMNGLGMQSLGRALPGTTLRVDDKKLGRLVSEVAREFKVELADDQWGQVRQLVSMAQASGLVPDRFNNGRDALQDDSPDWWLEAADELFLEEDSRDMLLELAHEVLERDIEEALRGTISFDDQVYVSCCIAGKFPQFPLLMVDEAQDLSPLNHAMVQKSVRPDGRLIVCGDPRQAIYGFRGADYTSIDKLKALRRDWIELPLTQTFRCSKAVVARQQDHAPGFRAAEANAEGLFLKLPQAGGEATFETDSAGWSWSDVEQHVPRSGSAAVLCRNNAPLLSLAFKLLRRRIPVVMLGRDIGQGLVALVKKVASQGDLPIASFAELLAAWKEKEIALATANGREEKIDGIVDKVECLEAVMSYVEVKDVASLKREITALFSRETGQVTLSSIHKAKGLEWDVVLLLDPWRIPSKQARREAAKGNEGPLQQEWNLKYVAETRSKNVLIHASVEDFE